MCELSGLRQCKTSLSPPYGAEKLDRNKDISLGQTNFPTPGMHRNCKPVVQIDIAQLTERRHCGASTWRGQCDFEEI